MERCFSCAEIGKCTELYARKPIDYRGPYFPIFERFNPPSSSNLISPEGTVKVCELCHIFLVSQWQNYERKGVVESRRIYFTKRHDSTSYNHTDHYVSPNSDTNFVNKSNYPLMKNGDQRSDVLNSSSKTPLSVATNINKVGLIDSQIEKSDPTYEGNFDISSKHLTEHHICCFVCGLPCLKWHAKTAYSSQVLENKEYFPFFEKLDPPKLSIGLTNGATKICIQCESDLQKQWEHYESLGTDQMMRTYHITNEHNNPFSIANPGRFITNSMVNNPMFSLKKGKNNTIKCAICPNNVIDPYNVSWSQRASCLFIANLKNFPFPNEGIIVDKQSEEAVICDVCHYFLSYQMQTYNSSMTPSHLREYKLPKVGSLPSIVLSSNDKPTGNNRRSVTLGSSSSAFSAPDGWQQNNSQMKRSKTPILKNRSRTPVNLPDNNRLSSNLKILTPNQDQGNVLGHIIANCHICLHELRDPTTLKTLPAVINEDNPSLPYFPFLKTLRASSMKNFEFPVCIHCYHNLLGQWRLFHQAGVPIHEQKYNYNEFMCTQCQHLVAQKADIVISRDRLLCFPCSESRDFDSSKNGVNTINQDTDATSRSSLVSMKAETTVTATPISNELSGHNLASLNYTETMKQMGIATNSKTSSTGTPISLSNSVNQFSEISRNPSEGYHSSKNLFTKGIKRPAVATVAPNQTQNTPHMSTETISFHSDPRIKMSEMANFHGNIFSQNSTFNSFPGASNYPNFPSNSAFGVPPPYPQIGNLSSPYFDTKSRINTPMTSTSSNPFINWTQHHQPEPNHIAPMPMQPSPFDPSLSLGSSNKEAEMTMMLYAMYQKQMQMANEPTNKFAGSWFNNPSSVEDLAMNYYQSMMAQHANPAMFPSEDLLSGALGAAPGGGNMQAYMMNAAMANYQYNQMLQMFAAYQQQAHSSGSNSKSSASVPSRLNQFGMAEHVPKRSRQDTTLYEQMARSKASSTNNGYNNDFNLLKYSEMLKLSMENEHEKMINSNKYPAMMPTNVDERLTHNHKPLDHNESVDKSRFVKQSRQSLNADPRIRKVEKHDVDVLDLSQSKPSRKSSYAIDALAELGKSYEKDTQCIGKSNHNSVELSALNSLNVSNKSSLDFEEPLNMYNAVMDASESIKVEMVNPRDEKDRLVDVLTNVNAHNLIDVLKREPLVVREPHCSESQPKKFLKCQTTLQIHKFIDNLNRLFSGSDTDKVVQNRSKSRFMNELGLQNTFCQKRSKSLKDIESSVMKLLTSPDQVHNQNNETYWNKWILKNLQQRFSTNVKPHLRRSLMRPVLSGDIVVRLRTARHKHEFESLRSIIKILKKFT